MATLTDLRKILGNSYDFSTNDTIYGTAVADTISIHGGSDTVYAGAGNDLIFDNRKLGGGSSGIDYIYAGDGDDTVVSALDAGGQFHGGNGTDLFIANATNGAVIDLAQGYVMDRTIGLAAYIGGFENATGSMLNDYIYGDANNNTLHGNWGDDLVRGNAGSDKLYGDRGQDVLFGGTQGDALYGGDGNDMLYGEADHDSLFGDAGNDILIGGAGNDYQLGGAGNDTFRFTALTDSGTTTTTVDTLGDFQHLVDRMDFSAIDARAGTATNEAFTFIGTANFSAAGQIRYFVNQQSQDTYVFLNTDNDSAAEMVLRIDPVTALSATDFVL